MPAEFHIPLNLRPHPARPSRAPEQPPHPISHPSTSRPSRIHARAAPHLISPPVHVHPDAGSRQKNSTSHFPPGHIHPDADSRQSNFRIPFLARPHPAHLVFTSEQLPHPISRPSTSTPMLTHARKISHPIEPPSTSSPSITRPGKTLPDSHAAFFAISQARKSA